MRGRLDFDAATARFGGLNLSPQELQRVRRFVLTACGTSWHAALVGEYQIESLARLPVEVEYASELRYRNPPLDDHTLLFAITQSGETADTLAALREMKRKGHPTLAICNVVGSTIAQEADGGHLPPRRPGNRRGLDQGLHLAVRGAGACWPCTSAGCGTSASTRDARSSSGSRSCPTWSAAPWTPTTRCGGSPTEYAQCTNFLYLGRQFNFPTALEGR